MNADAVNKSSIQIVFFAFLIILVGCSSQHVSMIKVYHSTPMEKSIVAAYPFRDIVYSSDETIELIAVWDKNLSIDADSVQWEIVDETGTPVHQTNVNGARTFKYDTVLINHTVFLPGSGRKTVAYTSIALDSELKEKFGPGHYRARLILNGKPVGSTPFVYAQQQKKAGLDCAVVFDFKTQSTDPGIIFSKEQHAAVSKTASFLAYSTIQRIFGHRALFAGDKAGCGRISISTEQLERETINSFIEKNPDVLAVSGTIKMGLYGQMMSMTVNVYHPRQKIVNRFSSSHLFNGGTFDEQLSILFSRIYYEEGLYDYLSSV